MLPLRLLALGQNVVAKKAGYVQDLICTKHTIDTQHAQRVTECSISVYHCHRICHQCLLLAQNMPPVSTPGTEYATSVYSWHRICHQCLLLAQSTWSMPPVSTEY